ncbi:MAG: hypothetical protein Q9220_007294 [cf. Caloplaca sp. 1 TL-2023]
MTDISQRQERQRNQAAVKTGSWLPAENSRLREAVARHGTRWVRVAKEVGTRNGDQCAKRWNENLNPDLDHSPWTADEDERLLAMIKIYGRNWKFIADNILQLRAPLALKNRYSLLMRRLQRQGQTAINTQRHDTSSFASSGRGSPSSGNASTASNTLNGHQSNATTLNTLNDNLPPHCGPWPTLLTNLPNPTIPPSSATSSSSAWDSPDILWHQPSLPSVNNNQYPTPLFDPSSSDIPNGIRTPAPSSISSPSNLIRSQSSTTATSMDGGSRNGGGGEVEYAVTCQWGKVKTLMNYLVDAAMSETAAWMEEGDRITVTLRLQA